MRLFLPREYVSILQITQHTFVRYEDLRNATIRLQKLRELIAFLNIEEYTKLSPLIQASRIECAFELAETPSVHRAHEGNDKSVAPLEFEHDQLLQTHPRKRYRAKEKRPASNREKIKKTTKGKRGQWSRDGSMRHLLDLPSSATVSGGRNHLSSNFSTQQQEVASFSSRDPHAPLKRIFYNKKTVCEVRFHVSILLDVALSLS